MSTEEMPSRPVFSRTERLVAWMTGLVILFSLVALLLWHVVFVRILPGEVGVRYNLFTGGTQVDSILPEGYALKWPWNRVYLYEIRTQQLPLEVRVLSAEGLNLTILANLVYRPRYSEVGRLQKQVGPEYRSRLLQPITTSVIRRVASQYDTHELYTLDFMEYQRQVMEMLNEHAVGNYFDVVDVPIRSLTLPPLMTKAIEEKLAQEQVAASYQFRLLSQENEAERKRIEAIGIRTFYSIVSEALTESLLTWRGIEATVEIARSPNTKIVIVGGNKDQMPLILGSDMTRLPTQPQPVSPVDDATAPSLPDWSSLPPLFPGSGDFLDSTGAIERGPLPDRQN